MKTGKVTGRVQGAFGTARHKCQDCGKNANVRVHLRDLQVTIFVCDSCSNKYVWA